jgi:hypothetical protein
MYAEDRATHNAPTRNSNRTVRSRQGRGPTDPGPRSTDHPGQAAWPMSQTLRLPNAVMSRGRLPASGASQRRWIEGAPRPPSCRTTGRPSGVSNVGQRGEPVPNVPGAAVYGL